MQKRKDIIKLENGKAVLDSKAEDWIITLESNLKRLKELDMDIKKQLTKEMESYNIIKLDTDDLTIRYIAPTDRESFDVKGFRSDNPELCDGYIRLKHVKPSVRVKVK